MGRWRWFWQTRKGLILQNILEGLRILSEYNSDPHVEISEGEIRVTLHPGTQVGDDDLSVLKEFGWRFSEGDWVLWV